MNWWLLGVSSVLVLAAGTFTALVYWANWELISGKSPKSRESFYKRNRKAN